MKHRASTNLLNHIRAVITEVIMRPEVGEDHVRPIVEAMLAARPDWRRLPASTRRALLNDLMERSANS